MQASLGHVPRSPAVRFEPSAFAGSPMPYTESFPAAAPAPASSPVPAVPAGVSGATLATPFDSTCGTAVAYLDVHAAPGFVASCPADAGGHQAATFCIRAAATCVPGTEFIWIHDPCPASYMNEVSNSWVLVGQSTAPWDQYGYCRQRGNPYG
jgi:hypothetical protein